VTEPDPWGLLGSVLDPTKDRDVAEFACLQCEAPLDACNTTSGDSPSPGDLSICVYCANVAQWDAAFRLQPIPPEEWARIPVHLRVEIEGAQAMIRASRLGGGREWKRGKT
jgi:hypothetical protein